MRSIALLALVTFVAGCALDRRGIGAGQTDARVDPIDSGSIDEDASAPPIDAWVDEDAGPIDSGPVDAGVPCGMGGQSCCDTAPPCGAGLACVDSTCVGCGVVDQPCCDGVCTDGTSCEGGVCRTPCGGIGEACCPGLGGCDASGTYCDLGSGRCAQCGLRGNLCCISFDPCSEGTCQFGTCS